MGLGQEGDREGEVVGWEQEDEQEDGETGRQPNMKTGTQTGK